MDRRQLKACSSDSAILPLKNTAASKWKYTHGSPLFSDNSYKRKYGRGRALVRSQICIRQLKITCNGSVQQRTCSEDDAFSACASRHAGRSALGLPWRPATPYLRSQLMSLQSENTGTDRYFSATILVIASIFAGKLNCCSGKK